MVGDGQDLLELGSFPKNYVIGSGGTREMPWRFLNSPNFHFHSPILNDLQDGLPGTFNFPTLNDVLLFQSSKHCQRGGSISWRRVSSSNRSSAIKSDTGCAILISLQYVCILLYPGVRFWSLNWAVESIDSKPCVSDTVRSMYTSFGLDETNAILWCH